MHGIDTVPVSECTVVLVAAVHTNPKPCALQIGMHFMNPVPIMALVELAKGLHTSEQTFEACKGLAEYLGKQVATSQDRPVSSASLGVLQQIVVARFCSR